MSNCRQADQPDKDLLAQVMALYHPRLCEHEVRVGLLYAHARRDKHTGQPKGPALKLHGEPALAIVKINSLQDRVEGKPDATVKVDGDQWPEFGLERKRAILDHELAHLLLDVDDEGQVKTDDAFRPKLRMRQHDFTVAGFFDIVQRHGKEAVEAQQYFDLHREMTQGEFPWG